MRILRRGISRLQRRSETIFVRGIASNPLEEYNRLVSVGKLRNDDHQKETLLNLLDLHKALIDYKPPSVKIPLVELILNPGFFGRLFSKKPVEASELDDDAFKNVPKGLYLWGDVGCGKTMLMDLFYLTVPSHLSKKRVHFHQFMQNLHKRSHEIIQKHGKSDLDPIPILSAEIATSLTVLCFDEFQVTDVADAMLLRRLLMTISAPDYGVVLFATSNREPNDLYINGVQRESFIPAIRLLERRTQVVYLNSPIDYRRIPKPISLVYYHPDPGQDYFLSTVETQKTHHIHEWFQYFTQNENSTLDQVEKNAVLKVWGRDLVIPKLVAGKVAIFSFKELCGKPLAAGDYLALAQHYRAFIITDIPYLLENVRDQIRRFITFLDAAYDNNCKLATTAANLFNALFVDEKAIKPDRFNLVEDADVRDYNRVKGGSLVSRNKELQDKLIHELGDVDKELLAVGDEMFALDEEKFAFVRALSRLTQMSTTDWVKK